MRIRKTGLVAVLSGLLMVTALEAQNPRPKNTLRDIRRQQDAVKVSLGKPAPRIPRPFQGFRVRPSAPLRFLASGEGRGYLEAIGHPLAPYLSRAFGANAEAPVAPPSFTLPQPANAPRISIIGSIREDRADIRSIRNHRPAARRETIARRSRFTARGNGKSRSRRGKAEERFGGKGTES